MGEILGRVLLKKVQCLSSLKKLNENCFQKGLLGGDGLTSYEQLTDFLIFFFHFSPLDNDRIMLHRNLILSFFLDDLCFFLIVQVVDDSSATVKIIFMRSF